LFQFLEGLSDRAAAFNLRYRIDWKIALGLELGDEGFHHSSLSRFRDRLLENEKASIAFDAILVHLININLIKKGGSQRIDSTHVIVKVRELSRLELLQETLRLFCEDACAYRPSETNIITIAMDRYLDHNSDYKIVEGARTALIRDAGLAMRTLIEWVYKFKIKDLTEKETFKVLQTVFQQNFTDIPDGDGPELIKIATGKDHVCSPHEPEARYGNKGGAGWIGYKAQIGETVPEEIDGELVVRNFITYAEIGDTTEHDGSVVADYIACQQDKEICPPTVYADTHYNTEANISDLLLKNIDLCGPVMPMPETDRTKPENIGFEANIESESAKCPEGNSSVRFSYRAQNKISVTFSGDDCRACSERDRCKPAPRGKNILIKIESSILTLRRDEMKTEEFKRDMHKRNGIEGTLSGLVRGQGLRNSRYRGKNKTRLQIKFAAASANIKRLHQFSKIMQAS
jgi:hypothetical protein